MKNLVFLGLVSTLSACAGMACTEIGYNDVVNLTVEADEGFWQEGDWEVTVDTFTCTFTLPSDEAELACEEDAQFLGLTVFFSEDGTEVEAIRASYQPLVEPAPETLDITLLQGEEVAFSGSISPDYDKSEPNGEGCGFQQSGEETLTLP